MSRLVAILFICAAAVAQAQTFTLLGSFNGPNGSDPANSGGSSLIQGPDGNFYGTTKQGGATGNGTIFKMSPAGALIALYSFTGQADGAAPQNGLTLASDGNFYGTTSTSIFKITPGGAFTTLYDATTGSLGIGRFYGLIQAVDGNLYGTSFDRASAFRVTPAGVVTVLYRFPGDTPDLNQPTSTLVQGSDGNLYGTAMNGNVSSVFKMTTSGIATTVATLPYDASPVGPLVQASDGNLYGVSQSGGINNAGSIFQIAPDGTPNTVYFFCSQTSCTDGQTPVGGLLQGKDGNFYGTTAGGGAYGNGTIFKLTPDGPLLTLYSFCAQGGYCSDGSAPLGTLVQASDGALYGAASQGAGANLGGVFSLVVQAFYVCSNTTPPVIASVNSASAYGAYPYFAPGSWLEIHGSNLADPNDPRLNNATHSGLWTSADFNVSNAPKMLDGIRVTVDGKPAFVEYLSPTQLNVQAPADSNTGNIAITATNCRATSSPVMVPMRELAPGLLAPPDYSSGGKQYMVATFWFDGEYVLDTALGASFGLLSHPAKPGDLITAYGVGFGEVNPFIPPGVIPDQLSSLVNPVTFSFVSSSGSTAVATLNYAGLAGDFVGLYEFYINVPMGLANGDYQVRVTQNGVSLPQTLYLTVQN